MSTWLWVVLLTVGLIKLPIAALMLWLPFRSDAVLESLPPAESAAGDSSEEDDGGSKTLPGGLPGSDRDPRVWGPFDRRGPRRGPPGCMAGGRGGLVPPPARVRTSRRGRTRVRARQ